ncbi:MAG: DUF1848 family protein [Desulfobacterales bacterium]|nr:DUF1848 family protein [Desulfobacterales bacterium]
MNPQDQIVISASRRSDIPAFYMDWFMAGIDRGHFDVVNPYNRRVSQVPAHVDRVHTIVFWSKNFGPFLSGGYGQMLTGAGYHLFFNFTVNSPSPLLEPNLPSLQDRLGQMADLCRCFGHQSVTWRFDPICFYQTQGSGVANNLTGFIDIAEAVAACGVHRCITSFMDHYAKIARRTAQIPGFRFLDPPLTEKADLLLNMAQTLARYGIDLLTCCEKTVMETLPAQSPIRPGACIDNRLLKDLFGGRLSLRRDSGQRVARGCGCRVSRDIGSYDAHPCYHNCLFCYANPVPPFE